MNRTIYDRRPLVVAGATMLGLATAVAQAQWTQWGGPAQDFKVSSIDLADRWPESGPPVLWEREFGEGHSSIIVNKDRLYTMGRSGEKEAVFCLDTKTGKTVWEHAYETTISDGHVREFGIGPRSTPLLDGDRLYAIGVSGLMHCLNAADGKVEWKKDLWGEFEGTELNHGYSSSPFAYKDKVIVMVGGEGHSLVAFDKKTGEVAWKRLDFGNSYSTPRLITIDGQDQLICSMAGEIVGVNPDNGDLLWQIEHANQWGQNIILPVWNEEDRHLVFSSAQTGSRGVTLARDGDKTTIKDLWEQKKIRFYHTTPIRVGDHIYGSSGEMSPSFFSAINVKTGDVAWRKRDFAKATCVYADGKFIILDEDGVLGLATATPDEFKIHSKVKLCEPKAWTVPTLVGKTLYIRDQNRIMALNVGNDVAVN